MNTTKNNHKIRKRVIFLGLSLGLLVNQIMIFQANRALAVDIVNPAPITATQHAEINPFDVINKVNQQQAEHLQNRQNSNQVINYDTNKPLVNYSRTTKPYTTPIQTGYYPQQVQNISQATGYGNLTESSYNPDRPEWIEFCPYGYENAKKDNEFHFWATNSRYKAEDQNYWVERRKDFEKHLAYCDKIEDSIAQSGCYQKLRQRQNRISANYVDPWKKAEIRQEKMRYGLGMWMMYDATKNKNVNVNHSGNVNANYNVNWHNW